ncbi:Beta-galactosidase C-terminal domain [Christensenellaceae bacterium OttesenSCG-928-M15]|nr:Beta-galactosidase C-terminal domain [Christensenellaceae bacterium OttesenSCG-928-M15]
MWYEQSIFYEIYPLGFCGAPEENDGKLVNRIQKVKEWIPHLQRLHVGAVYFAPLFESDRHGYDTRDYQKLDCRLGANEDFSDVCKSLHEAGIRVVVDGVFNHVGRGFFAFLDVLENKWESRYKDWFYINFDGDNAYGDGFSYEGWEGHLNLVKLNIHNGEVREHLFCAVKSWIDEYDIDGLRLDVAYMLDEGFLRELKQRTDAMKNDFYLVGEILHGDYKRIMNEEMLNSCTNYECFKGIYSSLNDLNFFEIAHSLNRQFGPEDWTLYKGQSLFNFVDNHDVNRLSSTLNEKAHLPLAYALLYAIPGVPCLYYGSEWGMEGVKESGSDAALRKCPQKPEWTALTEFIAALGKIKKTYPVFSKGAYRQVHLTNRQFLIAREAEGNSLYIGMNADGESAEISLPDGEYVDLITGEKVMGGMVKFAGNSVMVLIKAAHAS